MYWTQLLHCRSPMSTLKHWEYVSLNWPQLKTDRRQWGVGSCSSVPTSLIKFVDSSLGERVAATYGMPSSTHGHENI